MKFRHQSGFYWILQGYTIMAEKKEYRSAVRSRRLINHAFLELLQEKPFEKITVTDIVNRADINRSTFYAHYPDVRGLVEALMDQAVNQSVALVADLSFQDIFSDPKPFLSGLSNIGMDNLELYRLLGGTDFALKQVEKLKIILMEKAISAVDIPENIRQSNMFRIQISFFIGGILNTYQQWLQGTLGCSTEEIMDQIAGLIVSNAHTYRNWKD